MKSLERALRFKLGEDQKDEVVVSSGEVLHIPSNLPHKAEVPFRDTSVSCDSRKTRVV